MLKPRKKEYYEFDLLQALRELWHKMWAICLAAVIGGGAAFSYAAFFVTPMYEADAMMYVNNSSFTVGSTSFSITNAELTAAQSLVDTYIVILNSRSTLDKVIDEANLNCDYKTLRNKLKAAPVRSTEVFSITVTDDDPQEAELIANTIVKILPGRIADVIDGSSVRVVDYAVVPSAKASPNITKYTAIGMFLGIVAACAVIIVRMVTDTLIHNEDYLTETYELPVLAVIPNLSDKSPGYYSVYSDSAEKEVKL